MASKLAKSPNPTKERLIEAAVRSIEEGGEASVRVLDVVAEAEASLSSLYHFFGDRDGLIVAAESHRFRHNFDVDEAREFLEKCKSKELMVDFVVEIFAGTGSEATRASRRRRVEVLGSSVSRPELQKAIGEADELQFTEILRIVEEIERRGWTTPQLEAKCIAEFLHTISIGRYLSELSSDPSRAAARDKALEHAVRGLFRD